MCAEGLLLGRATHPQPLTNAHTHSCNNAQPPPFARQVGEPGPPVRQRRWRLPAVHHARRHVVAGPVGQRPLPGQRGAGGAGIGARAGGRPDGVAGLARGRAAGGGIGGAGQDSALLGAVPGGVAGCRVGWVAMVAVVVQGKGKGGCVARVVLVGHRADFPSVCVWRAGGLQGSFKGGRVCVCMIPDAPIIPPPPAPLSYTPHPPHRTPLPPLPPGRCPICWAPTPRANHMSLGIGQLTSMRRRSARTMSEWRREANCPMGPIWANAVAAITRSCAFHRCAQGRKTVPCALPHPSSWPPPLAHAL